jgi:general secretion pathway protein A
MYEAFYGFREKPFNLTPDPKFLYLSGKHHEAFAHLEFGLRQKGGFIVVTGEVGTGKTTLCRYFLERLDETTVSAFILYPALGTTELLRAVNRDLGVASDGESDKELIDALHEFLLASRKLGKSIVLVIDEAQNLSRDVLEQVRLISNLETNTEKLIQIVLIGQSELNEMLAQTDLRQLAQRITARYHLNPLSREETERYIRHRLAVAGGNGRVDFTPAAIRRIYRFSQGVPRLTNLACDRALLAGYVLETSEITASLVRRVVREVGGETDRRSWGGVWRWAWLAAAALGLVGLVALAGSSGALDLNGFPFWFERPRETVAESRHAEAAASPIAPGDAVERFELRLLTLSPELSPRAASAVLLERWGFHLSGGPAGISVLEDMPSLAERAALQYLELRTNLEQLRALDLPAVLEILPPSGLPPLHVTLTGLSGDVAVVSFAPGDELRLPVSVLERFLSGRAMLFWRDFDNLETADSAGRQAWTRARLATLGMLPGDSDESPHQLREAVKELQKRVHLLPDGDLDSATRMVLYSLSGGYRVPRLRQP